MTQAKAGPLTRFPPRCAQDILAYDRAECLAGCMGFIEGQPQPGPSQTPSYRWGWLSGAMDSKGTPERFRAMRQAVVDGDSAGETLGPANQAPASAKM